MDSQHAPIHETSSPRKTADLVAGLTASAVVLPKAMAYATVAGLPVAVGLYTAFIPMLIYALLGSSQRVTTTTLSAGSQTAGGIAVPAPVTGTALAVPENRLDAALARPLDASMFSSNIQTIGVVSGT